MKKCALSILFFCLFNLIISSVFAYDNCEPYDLFTNPNPLLPCSYNGYDYDSLAVESGLYVNSFFFKGANYFLRDNGWYWSLHSQVNALCDGLIFMDEAGTVNCSPSLGFNKLGALFFGVGASHADITTGLVAYYPFNGNANDESWNGNGNNGSIFNAGFVTGQLGSAMEFTGGLDSYVEVPGSSSLAPQDAVTISLWMKESTPSPAYSSLVYKAGQDPTTSGGFVDRVYTLWTKSDQGIHFASTPEGASYQGLCDSPGGMYGLNEFVHLSGVIDTAQHTMTIYVNGQKVQECFNYGDRIRGGDFPLRIGTPFHTAGDQFGFDGTMDEIRIYNRALSEAEVQALYKKDSNVTSVTCEQENNFDYGDNCSWPYSQTGTRCCCWCPDPRGAHAYGHAMDLGKVFSNTDVYFEIRPGAGDAGCVTTGYYYYSADGSNWTQFWTAPTLLGWTTYTGTAHITGDFRYIRANTDGCSVDWSKVEVETPPPPPACTYTYSDWGECQPNNTQTRTVLTKTPEGCVGTPVLSRSCDYVPPTGNLEVSKSNPAAGMVSSQDGFISCGAVCSHDYEIGSQVTLTAQAGYMYGFMGWAGGGCSGTGPCTITISENTTVTAQFIALDIPSDKITMLVPNEAYDPEDMRIPLILVHGHGQTEDWDKDKMLDDYEWIEAVKQAGWKWFMEYYSDSTLKENYKIYRFHYLSDIESVTEIGRGLRRRLDEAINQGVMSDTKIVIVAHSMGGLVARSYMQESGGGSRVKKLVTLATPHHGTPGANDMGLELLAKNADSRDKSWFKIWGSRIYNNNWTYTVKSATWIYWLLNSDLSYLEPNRKDLLWDNFDGVIRVSKDKDINKWLRDNLNADTSFDDRLITYYGYLNSNSPAYQDLVGEIYGYSIPTGPNVILTRATEAKISGDQHKQLLCASVLMNYGLYKNGSPYAYNDGMVPIQSARFTNHLVTKRVHCPDHDHLDMLGVDPDKKCSGEKSLLATLADDLNAIVGQ